MLRSANLFEKSGSDFHLRGKDAIFTDTGAVLSVKVLKTNRFLSNRTDIPLAALSAAHPLCPVSASKPLLRNTEGRPHDPLFCIVKHNKLFPMPANRFIKILLVHKIGRLILLQCLNAFLSEGRRYVFLLPDDINRCFESSRPLEDGLPQNYIQRDFDGREEFSSHLAKAISRSYNGWIYSSSCILFLFLLGLWIGALHLLAVWWYLLPIWLRINRPLSLPGISIRAWDEK